MSSVGLPRFLRAPSTTTNMSATSRAHTVTAGLHGVPKSAWGSGEEETTVRLLRQEPPPVCFLVIHRPVLRVGFFTQVYSLFHYCCYVGLRCGSPEQNLFSNFAKMQTIIDEFVYFRTFSHSPRAPPCPWMLVILCQ